MPEVQCRPGSLFRPRLIKNLRAWGRGYPCPSLTSQTPGDRLENLLSVQIQVVHLMMTRLFLHKSQESGLQDYPSPYNVIMTTKTSQYDFQIFGRLADGTK